MLLRQTQKRQLIEDALRDHMPWSGEGEDTRTLRDLRRDFERWHLRDLVMSYRRRQVERTLEDFDLSDALAEV